MGSRHILLILASFTCNSSPLTIVTYSWSQIFWKLSANSRATLSSYPWSLSKYTNYLDCWNISTTSALLYTMEVSVDSLLLKPPPIVYWERILCVDCRVMCSAATLNSESLENMKQRILGLLRFLRWGKIRVRDMGWLLNSRGWINNLYRL